MYFLWKLTKTIQLVTEKYNYINRSKVIIVIEQRFKIIGCTLRKKYFLLKAENYHHQHTAFVLYWVTLQSQSEKEKKWRRNMVRLSKWWIAENSENLLLFLPYYCNYWQVLLRIINP